MQQYLDLLRLVLSKGKLTSNRTGIDTYTYFGTQSRYDLDDGFPLLTTKKVFFKGIVHELLWFIRGDTNIRYLVKNKVKIWNEWPYEQFKKSTDYHQETIDEFIYKIENDEAFAKKYGELGPVYGKQWRDFNGVDQLQNAINEIKNNPTSRRIIVSAWNPSEVKEMLLPPCHALFQFYVEGNDLSLQLYQRSADLFLGVPFNIASYALLLILVADVCHLHPKEFVHTLGVAHIYENHLEQVRLQLTRIPKKLPHLKLLHHYDDITKYQFDDIVLEDYDPYPPIKGKVAV